MILGLISSRRFSIYYSACHLAHLFSPIEQFAAIQPGRFWVLVNFFFFFFFFFFGKYSTHFCFRCCPEKGRWWWDILVCVTKFLFRTTTVRHENILCLFKKRQTFCNLTPQTFYIHNVYYTYMHIHNLFISYWIRLECMVVLGLPITLT